ncbi:hypothetical protein BD770DRAFT_142116 [Pilaira anomala]|nr:hypothetical protein BD770DRAFT_142116 [Pilaira anomala]
MEMVKSCVTILIRNISFLFSYHQILPPLNTHYLLTIAEILTEGLINLIEQESENEDDLFTRLGRNHRTYALHNRQRLDIAAFYDDLCKRLFCFTYAEKKRITKAMRLPEQISFRSNSSQSFTMNRDYALAIMLRRLAYPSRLIGLELIFDIAYATIGMVFNSIADLNKDLGSIELTYVLLLEPSINQTL